MADTIVRVEDILGLSNKGGGGAVSLSALGQAMINGAAILSVLPTPLSAFGTTLSIIGASITAYTAYTAWMSPGTSTSSCSPD